MPARLLLLVVTLVLAACSSGAADRPVAAPSPVASAAPGAVASDPTGVPQAGDRTTSAMPSSGALQPSEGFARSEVVWVDGDRRIPMAVLVADTPDLRATGLMRRADLPDEAGMVFVHDDESQSPYWMMNVVLPLTIAFVGEDGVVQQLTDMEPCAAEPCPRYAAEQPYRYTVEANQGYYTRHGITPGWRLELPDALGGTP